MSGVKRLRKIQIGKESSAGTEVAATALWRGMGVLVDNREIQLIEEDIGHLMGHDRTLTVKEEGGMSFDEVALSFEQIGYILNAAILGATPGDDGTGSTGYLSTYTFPGTSQPTTFFYTIEGGDNAGAEIMLYSYVSDFSIKGNSQGQVTMQANWVGRTIAPTTFTAALSAPTVFEVPFGHCKLYIDGVSTHPATTQKTGTFLGFEFNYTSGLVPRYTGDGTNVWFTSAQHKGPEVTLKIMMEHETTSIAEKVNFRAETPRSARVEILGPAYGTPGSGTTFSGVSGLAIDVLGKWTEMSGLGDDDGNDTLDGTITARYNSTAGAEGQILLCNELAALP